MRLIVVWLVCFVFVGTTAQTLQFTWAHDTIGQQVQLLKKDNGNNIYALSSQYYGYDLDPSATTFTLNPVNGSWVMAKYDVNGSLVWAKNFGNTTLAIVDFEVSSSGNLFLGGMINGGHNLTTTVDINPSSTSVYTLTNVEGSDIFLAKFDNTCNFLWAFSFGNNQFLSQLCGCFGCGNQICYYPYNNMLYGLTVDASENVFIGGVVVGSNNDCDPGTGVVNLNSSGNNSNGFYAKYNTSGNYVNSYLYSTTNLNTYPSSYISDVVVDNNNDLILALDVVQANVDINPGAAVNTVGNGNGGVHYLLKYTNTGAYTWAYGYLDNNYSGFRNLKINSTNDVFTRATGVGVNLNLNSTPSYTFSSGPIVKYNASGQYQYGFVPNNSVFSFSDYDINNNDIFVVGRFNSATDFDPSAATYSLNPITAIDGYISKYSSGQFNYTHRLGALTPTVCFNYSEFKKVVFSNNHIFVHGNTSSYADLDFSATSTYSYSSICPVFLAKYFNCDVPNPPLSSTLPSNKIICSNATGTLSTSSTATVSWYSSPTGTAVLGTGLNFQTPTLSPGNYTYYAQASSCTLNPVRTAITITVFPNPTVTVNNGTLCNGQNFTIAPIGALSYTISGGSAIVSPTATATYTIIGKNLEGCVNPTPAICTISVNPSPTVSIASSDSLLCYDETAQLTAFGANTYTWNTASNSTSILISPLSTATYTVYGADLNNCSTFAAFTQSVDLCLSMSKYNDNTLIQINSIFPNPTSGHFTLETKTTNSARIYNVVGELILVKDVTPGGNEFDLSEFKNGLYFLQIDYSLYKILKE